MRGPRQLETPFLHLPPQLLKQLVELAYVNGPAHREDLLGWVFHQNHMVVFLHNRFVLHSQNIRFHLAQKSPLAVEFSIGIHPPAMDALSQLGLGQGQQLGYLGKRETVVVQPPDALQIRQLPLVVKPIAVFRHIFGPQQTNGVIVAQHSGGNPPQPRKFADGQHDIPPCLQYVESIQLHHSP